MRDSESAPNLINTLFQQRGFGDIIFRIVAQNNRITWEIQLNPQIADAVKRAILSFYPHADITQEDPESTEELSPDEQWVTDHVKEFSDFAREKYSVQSRGAIVIDEGEYWYRPVTELDRKKDASAIELVGKYDPDTEMAVAFLKGNDIRAAYRFYLDEEELEEQSEEQNKEEGGITTRLYGFHDFYAPLTYADEVKQDPLTGLVGAMTDLDKGDWIVYSLHLHDDTRKNYSQEGQKKIHKSRLLLIIDAIAMASSKRTVVVTKPASLDKYESHYQKLFEQKLSKQLLPVSMGIRINVSFVQSAGILGQK